MAIERGCAADHLYYFRAQPCSELPRSRAYVQRSVFHDLELDELARRQCLVQGSHDTLGYPGLPHVQQRCKVVRFGTQHPGKDLEQNTLGTWRVLEAMRKRGVRRIGFASTGSVYGEPEVFPTPDLPRKAETRPRRAARRSCRPSPVRIAVRAAAAAPG